MTSWVAERKTGLQKMAESLENFTAYYRMSLNVCVALFAVGVVVLVGVTAPLAPVLTIELVVWMMAGWAGHSMLLDDPSYSRMRRIFCGPYEQWLPQGALASAVLGPIYFIAALRATW